MMAQMYMPVLAAAAAQIVVGCLWYSDQLFGPMWRKLGGKAPSTKDYYQKLAMHGVAALLMATALYIAIAIFQKTQTAVYTQDGFGRVFSFFLRDGKQDHTIWSSMQTAGFFWLGFLAPSQAVCTIWSSGNWTKFMIEAGGQLAALSAMAAMIASLS